jgi:glucose-6-phosphate 1-epimerase
MASVTPLVNPSRSAHIGAFQGQPAVTLCTASGARATVLLHGAHVVSWIPAGGSERLYLSERSAFGDGTAVRGGVPVIFPQFNLRGPDFSLPKHGFARTRSWSIDPDGRDDGAGDSAVARFRLQNDAVTRAMWPHAFSLTLTVSLGAHTLDLALSVCNRGAEPLDFTAALHTYLQVADISLVSVGGLQGVRYIDTVTNLADVGVGADLTFQSETDRIYYEVPGPVTLAAPDGRLDVSMEGFRDVVVWNPWAERCASLPDMPPDGYRRMVCLEAAVIEQPVRLAVDGSWLGRQALTSS